ncbi:MAG TPA: hypothetical protein PKA63_03965 [Oligoflexia bacterium]|nr:hypothetical protein [Oligoflexia bacterium]HMP47807.1 hypothetical protein [Oligoflexia bacterium]
MYQGLFSSLSRLGFVVFVLGLGSYACGGDSDTASGSDEDILFKVNGELNDGRSVRFPFTPVRVYVENIPDGKKEIRKWTDATDNLINFEFVDERKNADIKIKYGVQAPLVCGVTYRPDTDRNGNITNADIELDPKSVVTEFLPFGCNQTVAHEIGHALGYFGHSDDGGLMDPDGGNGKFTDQTKRVMKKLYSAPPNTGIPDVASLLVD